MTKPKYDFSRFKAMVIDDQAFIRRVVAGMLRQIGFRAVEEACDGADGLKLNNILKPDVIICDIEMEPIDGLAFLQTIRTGKDVPNRNVPVVFLTSHAESEIVRQARGLHVNSFVVKPPSLAAITDHVAFVLFRQGGHSGETTPPK
ncbi:MAG: response regulator [Alphaproteobacteria bacterium]|nr:response regulator [Alphaproteobacteria bacterium]